MEDKANAEVLGGGEVTFSDDGSEAYLCIITTDKTKSDYTVEDLAKRLKNAGIVNGIDKAELQTITLPTRLLREKRQLTGLTAGMSFYFRLR